MIFETGSLEDFKLLTQNEQALLAYFSTDSCNVCKVLKPKVEELVKIQFPMVKMVYIKSDLQSEVAAQYRIFAAPTILVFFEGRETIRKSRNFSLDELRRDIDRPYSILFDNQ